MKITGTHWANDRVEKFVEEFLTCGIPASFGFMKSHVPCQVKTNWEAEIKNRKDMIILSGLVQLHNI